MIVGLGVLILAVGAFLFLGLRGKGIAREEVSPARASDGVAKVKLVPLLLEQGGCRELPEVETLDRLTRPVTVVQVRMCTGGGDVVTLNLDDAAVKAAVEAFVKAWSAADLRPAWWESATCELADPKGLDSVELRTAGGVVLRPALPVDQCGRAQEAALDAFGKLVAAR